MQEVGNAVTVRGAYKKYGSDVVLLGLDLTVGDSTIYGLLGPSGCGKTTLLRSIVGLMRLDAGEIYVKAGRKNNVGYMPQELGLYEHMDIVETFHYFGKLYGMKQEDVYDQSQDLVEFLELPGYDRLVGSLRSNQWYTLDVAKNLLSTVIPLNFGTAAIETKSQTMEADHLVILYLSSGFLNSFQMQPSSHKNLCEFTCC
ncbi:hypothetical protein J6590_015686 [Homalodisca vitripennis]|nr:hypothetical protein J6590_015686 [Homalodisca vitripennis]